MKAAQPLQLLNLLLERMLRILSQQRFKRQQQVKLLSATLPPNRGQAQLTRMRHVKVALTEKSQELSLAASIPHSQFVMQTPLV